MPLFSIIIPVYNTEKHLHASVESVLKQNFKNCEIVLVDDCSTDKSWALSRALSRSIPNVTAVRHKENLGVGAARNTGIDSATGDYIIFLDSDDRLADGALSGLAQLIREKPEMDIVAGKFVCEPDINSEFSFEYLFGRKGLQDKPTEIAGYVQNPRGFTSVSWCYVINRKFLLEQNLRFLPIRIFEDTVFVAKLLCLCKTFALHDRTFYIHKIRSGSVGQKMSYGFASAGLAAMNELTEFLSERDGLLTSAQKRFVLSRIGNIRDVFTSCLFMLSDEEVYNLSPRFVGHKLAVAAKLLGLAGNLKGKEIYIFCAGIYGDSVARALSGAGYRLKGFLDNNELLHGSRIFGLAVNSPKILSEKSRPVLAKTAVIICNQFQKNIDAISGQLRTLGLQKEQIVLSNILEII
ncbi:MAG: hypothetical protein UV75_C0003G0055 [Candidatus Giovannonibacteria bacterium GW2011_GWA1_43_15]|uniref:Glycosyltransferase 2-like domain-containing protein n=2 Tax=Candidatus Giovannoniibacteriota TaxID=1752738 RepID=A0A0G1LUP6_9BACT|nr:MAG: hypothetical protein UV72_C0007G0034 [Candidatus Giovannonibacteria bacterium GW2011_GWB1_43_13]KKS99579.1 MAG: hypothetical protein UV75_C0003G0055 [Candidatus Giovannonibacteria bacterium GW2011_GWA1_43_15]KKT20736.1 MAG: hypothetical protein UW05_C0030G0006 [Candidatus Giovannonibacteria bacterium GW2011_GWC2_43_8]KKT63434.1 MAG: hypothetical protein UW55_C0003G0002 [Candidatus Giovannonibacteria bacterium GW2011_GWA2_44_26]OGF58146.1 MAG: hypothetical protein A2652_02300 [Candidatus